MTDEERKYLKKELITPVIVWMILFVIALLFNRLGSKKPTPQTVSFFASVFSFTFIVFYGIKWIKFKTHIKKKRHH
ncbi:MAG: hypothetical protein GYB32_06425 [Algicola sp.]|nr:hypothetical protein [Algicola sp.]